MLKRAGVLTFRGSFSPELTGAALSSSTADVSEETNVVIHQHDSRIIFLCVTVARFKDSLGWTPLHLACFSGHADVVEELLKVRAVDDVHIILYIMFISLHIWN